MLSACERITALSRATTTGRAVLFDPGRLLALFEERKAKPHWATDSIRFVMATLGRLFAWRSALRVVKPDTFIRWHRKGFRLFCRWKSRPRGRPRLPNNLRQPILRMAAENPIWGEARIADELQLKLGIRVSPRTKVLWPATSSWLRRPRSDSSTRS
jgi:hypothetical protein